ncbi:hypothetical protein H5T88_05160 [bacterium]|nr:hypothetical protein [bacterium]
MKNFAVRGRDNLQLQAVGRMTSEYDLTCTGTPPNYTITWAGNTITYQYDSAGRLTRKTLPNGRYISYTYDSAGRRTSVTDYFGGQTSYSYDALGRLTSLNNPALGELGYYGDGDAGMYLLTQRWYNPVVGRFGVRDPTATERWFQINTYAYVMENPLNSTDPSGQYTLIGFPPASVERIRKEMETLCNLLVPSDPENHFCCAGKEAPKLIQCLKECCKSGEIIYIGVNSKCNGLENCGFAYIHGRKCKAYVCLMGLNESMCGPVGSTVAHEWIHSCGYRGEEYPSLVEKCLYSPIGPPHIR